MFTLLDLWQRYVDIIYAPEAEIDHMVRQRGSAENAAADIEQSDQGFAAKVQQEEVDKRLAALFSKDLEKGDDQDYMSVQEGLTTDTPLTSDAEAPERETATATTEQGIQSSEEEAEEALPEFNKSDLFPDERTKESIEHQFSFNDETLAAFKDKQLEKFETKQRFDKRAGGADAED